MARIALITDDYEMALPLKVMLEADGHSVTRFPDLLRLLTAPSGRDTDAVVLDLSYPGRDRIEDVLEVLRGAPHFRVIASAVASGPEDVRRLRIAKELGAHATLLRPALREEIRAALRAAGIAPAARTEVRG